MTNTIAIADRLYTGFARRLAYGQDGFLLLIRLYWGWQLAGAGWGKLTNVAATARYFAEIGIPMPTANAVLSGCGEFFGGLFLLLGLASRATALVLVINMLVALLTAHLDEARAVLTAPAKLITAPPFTHLLVSLIVLLFGPGYLALDTLVRRYVSRKFPAAVADAPVVTEPSVREVTRRQMGQWAVAAVGGLVAGAWLRGLAVSSGGQPMAGPKANEVAGGAFNLTPDAIQAMDAGAAEGLQPSLVLTTEAHICCGLNTCKGKAKGGGNACAGQGRCAIAEVHVCQGQNDCKGQGGCGEHPGENTCKAKGACAVPLKKKTWDKARQRFEELAAKIGAAVGKPPADCPKGA